MKKETIEAIIRELFSGYGDDCPLGFVSEYPEIRINDETEKMLIEALSSGPTSSVSETWVLAATRVSECMSHYKDSKLGDPNGCLLGLWTEFKANARGDGPDTPKPSESNKVYRDEDFENSLEYWRDLAKMLIEEKKNTPRPSESPAVYEQIEQLNKFLTPDLDEKELEDAAIKHATKQTYRSYDGGDPIYGGTVIDPDMRDSFIAGYRYAIEKLKLGTQVDQACAKCNNELDDY
jgi:hypothetical protein